MTYDKERARAIAAEAITEAARAKNNPPDLINVALERLIEASLELPGFTTLDEMASMIRARVNAQIFAQVVKYLDEIDALGDTWEWLEGRDIQRVLPVAGVRQPRRDRRQRPRRAGEVDQAQYSAGYLVIFHNALDLMDVVRTLVAEGWTITADELGALSPYLRAHIRRFGAYATDEIAEEPAAFNPDLKEIDFTDVDLAA
nr:Tn3 family transposase [Thermoactinospora rubra]